MKKILFLFNLVAVAAAAQNQPSTSSPGNTTHTTTTTVVKLHYDEFWLSGCIGGGAVVSTNIVNSGAVLPFRTEFLWQRKHRRLGFGFGNELEITPQSLTEFAFKGTQPGISKLYFVYEKFIFRNFPVNLGFSGHLGFFGQSGGTRTAKDSTAARGGLFGNVGAVFEVGIRPVYLFVRPDLEYQSWSGLHKQIQATGTVGIRLKFLSPEEKQRRAARKADRYKHRHMHHSKKA
ncbi:MAG: hypothetical protein HY063_10575 [Bacteroidetes bacterium]|nr:hypothetical protein [Bacteroidota bacterium]